MSYRTIQCPCLEELPPPPAGCHGWPWDVETLPRPQATLNGGPWPKISIVIPSFNHGAYLEEAIRSVLLQGYPKLELHLIDGGSSDRTGAIIARYEPWLTSWVSEPDHGQSDAINKGFARCDGEICNWLCSDDLLAEGALRVVAARFCRQPGVDVVAGACAFHYDDNPERDCVRRVDWRNWHAAPYCGVIWQPSCFFRRGLVGRHDLVRRDLHYCMDRELWAYLWSRGAVWERSDEVLSVFRFTGANKTLTGGWQVIDELDVIHRCYFREIVPLPYVLRRCWLPLVVQSLEHSSRWMRWLARGASRGVTLLLLLIYSRRRVRALQTDFYHYGGGFTGPGGLKTES